MSCLQYAMFFFFFQKSFLTFENPTTKVWHTRNLGESHDVGLSIVDFEGIPRTAGAHGKCLLTSKERKVKTSRDARLAVIPAYIVDNPRVGWIVWKKVMLGGLAGG